MRITKAKEFFEDWIYICQRLRDEGAIVQNDMEVTEEDIRLWELRVKSLVSDINHMVIDIKEDAERSKS